MTHKTIRPISIVGNTAFVPLTKGYQALIDAEDAPIAAKHNWRAHVDFRRDGTIRTVYAATGRPLGAQRQGVIFLHRIIMGDPQNLQIDHIDSDGLNCRRENLRAVTPSQNQHNGRKRCDNTSGAKGVWLHKLSGKWRAAITIGGKQKHLGLFVNIEDAKMAYAEASKSYHSKYGRTE